MFEKVKEKIQDIYWRIIPYNYRPGELWYKLACRIWYKYTTIKSRLLGHCYCDTTELLPYTMMEVFCRFMEDEVKEDCHIDWTYHKIEWKGVEVPIDSVWWECYEWWQNYERIEESLYNDWHNFLEKHRIYDFSTDLYWNPKFDTEENKVIASSLFKEATEKEVRLNQELEDWLILLVKTRDLMWT